MTTLKLTQYSGEIPRLIPRLLPDTAAQRAVNVRLEDGGLTPVRKKKFTANLTGLAEGTVQTVYKNGAEWLGWATQVDAAPGPVATDRLYYTGDGVPKMRVAGVSYPLAVPQPAGALTGTPSGTGSGNVTTLLYVYTWVTQWDEESEPCAASNYINWQTGQSVTLSGFVSPPAGRGITKQRIYRTQSGNTTSGLYFIAERAASNTNYVDAVNLAASQELIPSVDWNAPPDTLQGLTPLPNGMMAGFNGKDLMFCEPWRPHAWPEKYVLTTDYPIVAIGAFGASVAVLTTGNPYIATGTSPDSMTMEKVEQNIPCINARGVVDLGYSVAYPSNDGLAVISSSGASVMSNQLFTRSDWQKMLPATMIASQFAGRYFASYEYVEADGRPVSGSIIVDMTGQTPFLLRTDEKPDALAYDIPSGALYMLFGLEIDEWDPVGQANETLTWKSKQFILPKPSNFGAMMIDAGGTRTPEEQAAYEQQIADDNAWNAAHFGNVSIEGEVGGAAVGAYAVGDDLLRRTVDQPFVSVNVYADQKLVANVSTLNRIARLPAGFEARIWEFEVNANTQIAEINIATNAKELALV
jgi:methionine-rich copper-binding protein CopC